MGVRWTAFPLHPDTPQEGLSLHELFGSRMDIDGLMVHLREVAEELGLPWGEREKTYNTRLAQELGKWAEAKGRGDDFHKSVFRAYFVDGRNIGRIAELVELAESLGLPGEEAQQAIQKRAFKNAVDIDWARSVRMGVTGVPTFMIGHQSVVGAQPYETLEHLMKTNNIGKRRR